MRENQRVKAGDVLFTIDARTFNVALNRADAQLAAINDVVESTRASYRQALEQLSLARTNAAYEQREFDRLTALAERKLASDIDVDEKRHDRDVARQEIVVTERSLEQIRARLGGDLDRPVTEQAAYLAAKSMRDAATLDVERTVVRAPFDGIASNVPTLASVRAARRTRHDGRLRSRHVGRSQLQGDRPHARRRGPTRRRPLRHISRSPLEGTRREHQPSDGRRVLGDPFAKRDGQLGQGDASAFPCASPSRRAATIRRCAPA